MYCTGLTLCKLETPKRVLWQTVKTQMKRSIMLHFTSEDPDETQHNAAFHQDLHCKCLLRLKQSSGTEIHHNWEMPTYDPLKYIMDNHILIAFICMGKSIRIQRVSALKCIIKMADLSYRISLNKIVSTCKL